MATTVSLETDQANQLVPTDQHQSPSIVGQKRLHDQDDSFMVNTRKLMAKGEEVTEFVRTHNVLSITSFVKDGKMENYTGQRVPCWGLKPNENLYKRQCSESTIPSCS